MQNIIHKVIKVNRSKMLSKHYFMEYLKTKCLLLKTIVWAECTDFDNKNGSFDEDECIWKIKNIRDGNSHLWHQKYSLPFTKVLGFNACRVTKKVSCYWFSRVFLGWCKKIKLVKDLQLAVMYQRNRVFLYICVYWLRYNWTISFFFLKLFNSYME